MRFITASTPAQAAGRSRGQIIYHCGPVMVKEGDQWICKAAGPTTSSRERAVSVGGHARLQDPRCDREGRDGREDLGRMQGVRSRLSPRYRGRRAGMRCLDQACPTASTGWNLGSPEAIWHLWVEDFMPSSTMDAHGQSLHKNVFEESKARIEAMKV